MMMMPCVEELPSKEGLPWMPSKSMLLCKVGMPSTLGLPNQAAMPTMMMQRKGLPSLHNTKIKVPSNNRMLSQARETWKQ